MDIYDLEEKLREVLDDYDLPAAEIASVLHTLGDEYEIVAAEVAMAFDGEGEDG